MTVSVYTPTFNQRPELLDACVQSSLNAGADQVVVVDDGSSPEHVVNVWGDRVTLIRTEHRGICHAFNVGIPECTGDWICRLPSDDVMFQTKINRQRNWMTSTHQLATFHDVVENGGAVPTLHTEPSRREKFRERLAWTNLFYGGTTMVAAGLMHEYIGQGGHPENLPYGQDWHFANWIEHRCKWRYIPEVLVIRGRYDHGVSAQADRDPVLGNLRENCRSIIRARWDGKCG